MDARNSQRGGAAILLSTVFILAAGLASCSPDPIDQIREADLSADLFALAGDHYLGREAGTLDELTASVWLADRARDAGLEPAGDDGTYFQWFPVERFRVSEGSRVTLAESDLQVGLNVVPQNTVVARVDAPVLLLGAAQYSGQRLESGIPGAAGQVIVSQYAPTPDAEGNSPSLAAWGRGIQQSMGEDVDPAAVVILVPENEVDAWARVAFRTPRGSYTVDIQGDAPPRQPNPGTPVLYIREDALERPVADGDRLDAWLFTETFTYPSVNIVARVPGRDPALADEYVLFSSHQDHNGARYPVEGDSIINGADDNATTSVALLAIGRAFAQQPGRRGALFVWHGAEERGLLGSRWYAERPTVPKGSIIAVLNGDMIGRNHPDTAALLGATSPHMNSPEFVEMALAANEAVSGFVVDHSWDDPDHNEGWYYRSDHLSYARIGIPALFFTTLLHPDYHTPFDNPDRIDTEKLTRMTRWMYETGRRVAEADAPPAVDPNFELERCRDFTGNYCAGG